MTTWRQELENACELTKDNFDSLVVTLSENELDVEFYDGYGGSEGLPFTAWSKDWVYFPVVYDGSEWVGWVPRNPCDKKTHHVGGE
jgi:hypothetical protein